MLGRRRSRRSSESEPTGGRAAPTDRVADALALRRSSIEAELGRATGGEPLCAISKAAGSVPAAKYFEGHLAAVFDLQRAQRNGEPVKDFLDRLTDEWQRELRSATDRRMGPDWQAYRAGGVDELDVVRSLLAGR